MRIAGEVRGTSASPLRLIVGGINLPGALALSSLEIGGGMHFAEVLGGYKLDGPLQANVNFGVILVRGSWEASSIAVGVESGTDGLFGTNDDVAIGGGLSNVGHLARVIIGGSATGTTQADDSFGISARRIGALTVGPRAISLTAGLDVSLLAATGDFFAREVPGV